MAYNILGGLVPYSPPTNRTGGLLGEDYGMVQPVANDQPPPPPVDDGGEEDDGKKKVWQRALLALAAGLSTYGVMRNGGDPTGVLRTMLGEANHGRDRKEQKEDKAAEVAAQKAVIRASGEENRTTNAASDDRTDARQDKSLQAALEQQKADIEAADKRAQADRTLRQDLANQSDELARALEGMQQTGANSRNNADIQAANSRAVVGLRAGLVEQGYTPEQSDSISRNLVTGAPLPDDVRSVVAQRGKEATDARALGALDNTLKVLGNLNFDGPAGQMDDATKTGIVSQLTSRAAAQVVAVTGGNAAPLEQELSDLEGALAQVRDPKAQVSYLTRMEAEVKRQLSTKKHIDNLPFGPGDEETAQGLLIALVARRRTLEQKAALEVRKEYQAPNTLVPGSGVQHIQR